MAYGPISVRSTNVYEEKSLGVFTDEDDEAEEESFVPSGNRAAVWGRYLAMHARKQLSFGMYSSGDPLAAQANEW